jgi:predicted negative regulator of RcsB-dependent stress response
VEIYDSEEEQVAAIKRWWKEHGTSTITGAIVGVLLLGGWNFWQGYTGKKANEASALYNKLLSSVSKEDYTNAEIQAKSIAAGYDSTAYKAYAALMMAKVKIKQGDMAAAKEIFETQMTQADSVELRNVARIRLVRLLHSTGEYEKGLQALAEADQAGSEGFAASFDELKGDLYVALDRLGEARTAYESALRSGNQSRLLQFKLDDITAADVVAAE